MFSHNQDTPRHVMREHVLTQSEHTQTRNEITCSHTIRTLLDKRWHNQNTPRQHMREHVLTQSEHNPTRDGKHVFTQSEHTQTTYERTRFSQYQNTHRQEMTKHVLTQSERA